VAETWGSPAWLPETYGDSLADLTRSGDELGLHTHTWRWETEGWFADFEDPAWAEHCLTVGLDAFEASFGRPCTVHRGGDRFLSGAMLSCLDRRGVAIDLTVEPGMPAQGLPPREHSRGVTPDYQRAPTVPYRSSPQSFPAPDATDAAGPLLVPLLSAPGRRGRRSTLPPDAPPVTRFVPRLALELLRRPPSVLAVVVRTDAALDSRWDSLVDNLEHLARHRQMPLVTASAAVERLDALASARPGGRPTPGSTLTTPRP
jgi:hypothetical protein